MQQADNVRNGTPIEGVQPLGSFLCLSFHNVRDNIITICFFATSSTIRLTLARISNTIVARYTLRRGKL